MNMNSMALKQWQYDSTFYLSLFFIIISTMLFVFKLSTRSKSKLNLPPSPPKLPIIGHLHLLGSLPHRSLKKLSHKYGDMMLLQLGMMQSPTLVVSSADVAMEIMKNQDLNFSNRPQFTPQKILFYGCNDVAFGNYGEKWKNKRKILVHQLLSSKRVQSFSQIRKEEIEGLIKKTRELSGYVNLSEMFLSIANDFVCKCALGHALSTGEGNNVKELARRVTIQLLAFNMRDFFPLFGFVDVLTGKIQGYKATVRAMDALFDQVIAERKNLEREGDHNKDFLDILLQFQEGGKLV
ncbi:hypothetical protein RIF29_13228 [Crotalaria pallida]|uniref:Cytochrome P450 n=1 Tax=Crotalaria pallida TaxID=3830 RepID=A0AAN9IP06_CROPI